LIRIQLILNQHRHLRLDLFQRSHPGSHHNSS
jgi:hypothetical protein